MSSLTTIESAVDRDGYAIVEDVLPPAHVEELIAAIDRVQSDPAIRLRNSDRYAMRNLLTLVPEVKALAEHPRLREWVDPVLGPSAFAVRGILFDKTPAANWKVAWHQDLSIAVNERIDSPGFGPWSVKAGVPHVQPPASVLQEMLTVRIHLDDCGEGNGPLKVLPGSHTHGVLRPERVEQMRESATVTLCTVKKGGVLLMRPLILHASSTASVPGRRRVIHVEFASGDLPGGLRWYER